MKPYKSILSCSECDKKWPLNTNSCECGNTKFNTISVYNIEYILSFNFFHNNIFGARGTGKSHSIAEYLTNQWKDKKRGFIWVKRVREELIHGLDIFIKFGYNYDSKGVYEEEKYTNEKGKEKIRKNYFGFNFTISTARNSKGRQFPNCDIRTIWWDEYALETGFTYEDEFSIIQSLAETIFRNKKDCRFICSNNNANPYLPICVFSDINWEAEFTFNHKKDIITHIATNLVEPKGATAKWIKAGNYYDYAYKNKSKIQDKFLINAYDFEFNKPEFCFKFSGFKEALKFIKTDDLEIIDICRNCKDELVIVDEYNSIQEMRKINNSAKNELANAFYSKKLKFTRPELKQLYWNWFIKEVFK